MGITTKKAFYCHMTKRHCKKSVSFYYSIIILHFTFKIWTKYKHAQSMGSHDISGGQMGLAMPTRWGIKPAEKVPELKQKCKGEKLSKRKQSSQNERHKCRS